MKRIFLVFLFSAFKLLYAQTDIKNLVFEGAGIRGIAYCGAIQEMEAKNMMGKVEKVGGTSSGGILALTLSLGYSGKEIEDIISTTNFSSLFGRTASSRSFFSKYFRSCFNLWCD